MAIDAASPVRCPRRRKRRNFKAAAELVIEGNQHKGGLLNVAYGSWLCKNVLAEALTSGGDPGRGGRVR